MIQGDCNDVDSQYNVKHVYVCACVYIIYIYRERYRYNYIYTHRDRYSGKATTPTDTRTAPVSQIHGVPRIFRLQSLGAKQNMHQNGIQHDLTIRNGALMGHRRCPWEDLHRHVPKNVGKYLVLNHGTMGQLEVMQFG